MNTYQLQLTQTLYWTVEIEVDEEDQLSELEDHYSFADNEEREAKVLTKDGEKYEF